MFRYFSIDESMKTFDLGDYGKECVEKMSETKPWTSALYEFAENYPKSLSSYEKLNFILKLNNPDLFPLVPKLWKEPAIAFEFLNEEYPGLIESVIEAEVEYDLEQHNLDILMAKLLPALKEYEGLVEEEYQLDYSDFYDFKLDVTEYYDVYSESENEATGIISYPSIQDMVQRVENWCSIEGCIQKQEGIRGLLIGVDEQPKEIIISKDKNGSFLASLQELVDGLISTYDVLFNQNITLYINDEGLYTCSPNRAIFATKQMEEEGYLDGLTYSHVVKEGELTTVLYGNIVACGFDPESGENRSLTTEEMDKVAQYFSEISKPHSGLAAVMSIRQEKSSLEHLTNRTKQLSEVLNSMSAHEIPSQER